ncbi:hypothetical protein B0A50_05753 [Salinomyces thailandicus]|uniref:Uncharacterized protein n=1 Tax=Salinomyces thailandicus TaxID=706561 RepID=A0A4U0TSJ3_9PEZI|nr:hypothetical protein B0A50_05753 [Salinomyces thailandica]
MVTVDCHLEGGTRASQAMCTGHSVIAGLGNGTDTTTLASSQLNYVPITVTAGQENLPTNSSAAGASSTGSEDGSEGGDGGGRTGVASGGGAPPMRTMAICAVGAVAGVLVVGLL